MYQFVSAIAKPRASAERWQSVNLSDMMLPEIYQNYRRVIVRLSNPVLSQNVSLDLENVRALAAGVDLTFADWLVSLGNKALPTVATLYELQPRYAKYADAIHAGYKAVPVYPGAPVDAQYPPSEKIELLLTKEGLNYTDFNKYCLVNVNGFFHRAVATSAGVRVVEANKSAQRSGLNHVGIVSFEEVGSLQIVPITAGMLYKHSSDQSYKNRVFINTGVNLDNVIVMAVIGGYLHVLDDKVLWRTGQKTLGVAIENIPMLDRYYQSKKYLDLSSLGLSQTPANPDQIGLDEFFSDAAIQAYLTLSQSFLVLVSTSDLFVERSYVRKSKVPDLYTSYIEPVYPLVVDAGQVTNYWYTAEDGQYSLTCFDTLQHNRLYDTIAIKQATTATPARVPMNAARPSKAFFLKIGTELAVAA